MEQHDSLATSEDESGIRGLSRRDFVRLLGAAGVTATVGSGLMPRAGAAQAPGLSPLDLNFTIRSQFRPFDIVASQFVEHDDAFDTGGPAAARLAPGPEDDAGTATVRGGRLEHSGDGYAALYQYGGSPVAPYAAVQVEVASFSETAGATQDTVMAGLVRDAENYIVATYNRATSRVAIDVVLGGRRNRLNEATLVARGPFTFSFVLNENAVTALVDRPGEGPRPVLRSNVAADIDMRDPAVLRRFRYGFGVRATSGAIALASVRAGYWGKAGVRDPHVVTYADGTPYVVDGKLYLTMTNAGLGFFQAAHWGVYTLDLANYAAGASALEEVGKIFYRRGGRLVGDHAGHVVFDETISGFRVLASTWGTFSGNGVRISSAVLRTDSLAGVHLIREPTILNLPTEFSRWDPHIVKIDGRWHVAFVESPSQTPFRFYPALARGRASGAFGGFELIGRDPTRTETEGMIIQKFGGRWYVLCSSSEREGLDGDAYRIYDLELRFIGFLNAPHPTNIPHPVAFPVPIADSGTTRWLLVTFNGTQYFEPFLGYGTHGDFFVMEAQNVPGLEFPPKEPGGGL